MTDENTDVDHVERRAAAAADLDRTRAGSEDTDTDTVQRAPRDNLGRPIPEQASRRRLFLVLAVLGVATVAGAVVLGNPVLLALGGGAVFLSLFAYVLAPDPQVGRDAGVFARLAHNQAAIAAELRLSSSHVYVPTGHDDPPVRLFVPRRVGQSPPPPSALEGTFVSDEETGQLLGLGLEPTGLALLEADAETSFPESPNHLVQHLCSSIVDRYELAGEARPGVDGGAGRATVTFRDPAYGPVEQFDHPLRSFVAIGIATGLGVPVTVEVIETGDESHRIRYLWPVTSGESVE